MARAGNNQGTAKMVQAILRRTALAALAVCAFVAVGAPPAAAQNGALANAATAAAPGNFHRTVKIGLNKSIIVDLPRDARDILVSNPNIADAVIRTARRIYITGVSAGQSDVIVLDRAGNQIVSLDLEVERDTAGLSAMLRRLIPDSDIKVDIVSDNIVLSGTVRTAADAARAQDVANIFANGGPGASGGGQSGSTSSTSAGGPSGSNGGNINVSLTSTTASSATPAAKVVNLLTIEGEDQVHLKVTVAEVQRNIAKQLGIEMTGSLKFGHFSTCTAAGTCSTLGNPFGVNGGALSSNSLSLGFSDGTNSLSATLQALEQTGMIRTLAEPTLTAISGETASFLAGGEYPVPTGRDQAGNVSISFKPYGVALDFTPVVLSEGRISLKVKTEVSSLTTDGSISVDNLTIPALKVRRADSTVELPSGGALVMGGMLQDNLSQSIAKFPGLGDLPILGPLFRSRDFQRNETELVIIVTPYLVKPTAPSALAMPGQGLVPAGDAQANFLGDINRVYGARGAKAPAGTYQGNYGFIIE